MKADKSAEDYLAQIAKDMAVTRDLISKYVNAQHEAESEIPEKLRRFVTYWHAIHNIVNIYEERGNHPPMFLKQEMERCDDRFRQLLEEAHTDGNVFEQVRRKMTDDPNNRWDHTRAIGGPK
jgi:thioesterase domain-containing protein